MTVHKATKIRKGRYNYRGYTMVYGRTNERERCLGHRNWICIDIRGRNQWDTADADTKAEMMAMIDAHIEEKEAAR